MCFDTDCWNHQRLNCCWLLLQKENGKRFFCLCGTNDHTTWWASKLSASILKVQKRSWFRLHVYDTLFLKCWKTCVQFVCTETNVFLWNCLPILTNPIAQISTPFSQISCDSASVYVCVSVSVSPLSPLRCNCVSCFAAHKKPRPQSLSRMCALNYLHRAAHGTVTQEILLHVSSFPPPRGSEASSLF